MGDARSTSLLLRLGELEHEDAHLAAAIEHVSAVAQHADEIRARVVEIATLLASMPDERARLDEAEAAAQRRAGEARRELEESERRLAEIERSRRPREEQRAQARREVDVAADALAAVESHLARIAERRLALDEDEHVLQAEGEGLAVAASGVAGDVAAIDGVSDSGRCIPGRTLAELDEWGARVHAALFVVRGSLESRRDRVVGEANVLAAAVLVEPLTATSVADVRRRVDAALS